MDRAGALAGMNRRFLETFSRRTTGALRAILPLRLALPRIEPFLALNVAKEVRKDAIVIRRAAQALAQAAPPDAALARQILEEVRAIDREFLGATARFPVRIEIPYARIDPLRLRRIGRGLDLAYRILEGWRRGRKLREVLAREELERRLRELLELYAEETQALSHSVQLPGLLAALRERLARGLQRVMNEAARQLALEAAHAVHRQRPAARGWRDLRR
ncbi:MAG: hypothetical protein A3H34_02540 [Betaproteobacteria bacterium RIFCSPLOWO2_02_FULL_67_19]|nr:MAG: hypothetical protein A3H34_02540 [Betaproteobacteria bacterium RIFCSPLOWO2_02_FULL_67_19]